MSEPIVAIVDYGSGNLRSAAKAFERVVREGARPHRVVVSARPDEVAAAERVVLPGVGAFADCRRGLAAVAGMEEAIGEAVRRRGQPFLGICVGMQLMAERGLEHGRHEGFGWLAGEVVPIATAGPSALKIPHMGWNELELTQPGHPLCAGLANGDHVYFVHGYHFASADAADVLASVDYGSSLSAVVARDNLAGTQFHPEKSQTVGLRLIANFLDWRP